LLLYQTILPDSDWWQRGPERRCNHHVSSQKPSYLLKSVNIRYMGLIARQIGNRTLHRRTGLEPHKNHKSVEMARVYRETTAKTGGYREQLYRSLSCNRRAWVDEAKAQREKSMPWVGLGQCAVGERETGTEKCKRERKEAGRHNLGFSLI